MRAGNSKMNLYFNDLSIHGQFHDIPTFTSSIDVLMSARQLAKRYSREINCHRSCVNSNVTPQMNLHQAVQRIDKNKARVLMSWLSRAGPFWEDARQHPEDEYFECHGDVVTDTAIGECAYVCLSSATGQLFSLTPSDWNQSPIEVNCHKESDVCLDVRLLNHIDAATLERELICAAPPIRSWEQLREHSLQRFINLNFSEQAFLPLRGRPFVNAAADSFLKLLDVLDRFRAAHEDGGGRTAEGNEIYQTYFTGDLAWFSDSSDQEKVDFQSYMTFPHPEIADQTIFATYHGKVQTPQMRVHISWPVQSDSPLYVLYVGDKITKY